MNKHRITCVLAAILLSGTVLASCDSAPADEVQSTEPITTTQEITTEAPTETQEETTEEAEVTTDLFDAIVDNPDYYKNEVKLNHKSIMFCANEFKGEFHSVHFENHGLMLDQGSTEGYFVSDEIDIPPEFDVE